jgi:hypothetical protein
MPYIKPATVLPVSRFPHVVYWSEFDNMLGRSVKKMFLEPARANSVMMHSAMNYWRQQ